MSDQSWEEIFARLFTEVIEVSEKNIDEDSKKEFYLDLIDVINAYDEDVYKDLMGLSITFDEALLELNPSAFDEFIEDIED